MVLANGRRRKTRIFRLEQDERVIEEEKNLNKFITKFYKEPFGASQRNEFSLDEAEIVDNPQVNQVENDLQIEEFAEKEMRDSILQMKHNKAMGPEGFLMEFQLSGNFESNKRWCKPPPLA